MTHEFIILGDVEFIFEPTNRDAVIESKTSSSRFEEDQKEFELINFTGKIIIKRQGNKIVRSLEVESESFIDEQLDMSKTEQKDTQARSEGVSFDLSKSNSKLESRDEHSVKLTKMTDRSSFTSYLSALEGDEDNLLPESSRGLDEDVKESHKSSLVLTEETDFRVGPGSELHLLCESTEKNVDDLRSCLMNDPSAPFTFNEHGQTPLHVLTENVTIWQNKTFEVSEFCTELIAANPTAVALIDRFGRWPFAAMLKEWTEHQYRQSSNEQSNMLSNFVRNVGTAVNSTASNALFSLPTGRVSTSEGTTRKVKCKKASLTEVFSSALQLLSYSFTSTTTVEHLPAEQQLVLRERTCKNIVTEIPLFLQTLLMIEPEVSRLQVLSLPLVKRLLLEPITVGPWIVSMVRSKGTPGRRAVDYLEILSDTCFHDFLPDASVVEEDDKEEGANASLQVYRQQKTEVFDGIGEMGEFLLSLFALNKSEMQRATSTKALWHVIQYLLQRQFIIGIVLVDFVLHLTWMLSFRADVIGSSSETDSFTSGTAGLAVSAITIFFALRKISEGMALFSLSKTVFRHYMLDFWNLFDLLAIIMLIVANGLNATANELNPGYNSFVLALLWLKILSFLKAVNRQMATFILACIQIIIDIRYFLIVLVVCIMMFGDIMVIVFKQTKDSETGQSLCDSSDETDAQGDFCSSSSFDSYVRMYGILLGDFAINEFKANKTALIVFLFFTMVGVIILLNILIAVVSDSYEKATARSKALFGVARVGFLAEHIALEHFLQPGKNPLTGITQANTANPRACYVFCKRMIRYLILLAILVAASLAEVFLVELTIDGISNNSNNFVVLVTVFMSFVLTVSLWVVLHYLFTGFTAGRTINIPLVSPFLRSINWFMFGCINALRKVAFGDGTIEDDEVDEWVGHREFLERMMTSTVAEAEDKLMSRIQAAEESIKENEERLSRKLQQEL